MPKQIQEIAYLRSSFIRVVQISDNFFEVQSYAIRGEGKAGNKPTFWKTLYGVFGRDKAIMLLESYA